MLILSVLLVLIQCLLNLSRVITVVDPRFRLFPIELLINCKIAFNVLEFNPLMSLCLFIVPVEAGQTEKAPV